MVMDQPKIDYGSKKRTGNSRADVDEMNALADAWAAKKAKEGDVTGEAFSLSEFVQKKV